MDLALAFHHTVRDDQDQLALTVARLRETTRGGDFAYYVDIAHFMADLPLPHAFDAQWIGGEQSVRERWRGLVTARRDHLRATR
ncbi:hypothetical protein [Streptomyces purpurascens]|uniref:hypothetical protein n=1 Tax=Streptomyces purpurascens TaxID=1924 RepID=UPI003C300329